MCAPLGCADSHQPASPKKEASPVKTSPAKLGRFGIQLYTLRDVIVDDPMGTTAQLADFGYHQIESYVGPQGMFWGLSGQEFRQRLEDMGLELVASHCDINENFEQTVAEAAKVGLDYLVCPWVGPSEDLDFWKARAEQFNRCGEICRANGLRFAYHNHAYTYRPVEDWVPMDYLLEHTDPELVQYEMDIYWVVTAQADPVQYLQKYPDRFRLCHIKDRQKDVAQDVRNASCNLGDGIIDFPSVLAAAQEAGMEYYLLEQEEYEGTTPMEAARVGAAYLKNL